LGEGRVCALCVDATAPVERVHIFELEAVDASEKREEKKTHQTPKKTTTTRARRIGAHDPRAREREPARRAMRAVADARPGVSAPRRGAIALGRRRGHPAPPRAAKRKDKRYPDEFSGFSEEESAALSADDPLRSAAPPSATFVRDAEGNAEMVYDCELPAIDMGITFREAEGGNKTFAVVESVRPDSPAANAGVAPGDVLVRCTATVLKPCDTPVTVGGPGMATKHERVEGFECIGEPFETQMAALRSSGIVDAGAKRQTSPSST
jgi:hypothetical protein